MKILSEYHSDNSEKQALVYKEGKLYTVRMMATNKVMVKSFKTEQEAEERAEDWVMGENDE